MLLLGMLAAACPLVFALETRLTDITVSNTRDDLLLYVTLEGAFSPELKEIILSGVPATFSFPVKLNNVRNMWFDREIADIEVTHTIRYDNLKKEFAVRRYLHYILFFVSFWDIETDWYTIDFIY